MHAYTHIAWPSEWPVRHNRYAARCCCAFLPSSPAPEKVPAWVASSTFCCQYSAPLGLPALAHLLIVDRLEAGSPDAGEHPPGCVLPGAQPLESRQRLLHENATCRVCARSCERPLQHERGRGPGGRQAYSQAAAKTDSAAAGPLREIYIQTRRCARPSPSLPHAPTRWAQLRRRAAANRGRQSCSTDELVATGARVRRTLHWNMHSRSQASPSVRSSASTAARPAAASSSDSSPARARPAALARLQHMLSQRLRFSTPQLTTPEPPRLRL